MRLREFYPSKNIMAFDPMSRQPFQGGIKSAPGEVQFELYEQAGAVWVVRWGPKNVNCPKDSADRTAYLAKFCAFGVSYFSGGAEAEAMARELADKNPPPKDLSEAEEVDSPKRRKAIVEQSRTA